MTEEDLRQWFSSLKTYLEKRNLLNLEARNIFNLDETAFMLVPKDNTVITKKGSRAVYQIVGSSEKAILIVLKTTPKRSILSSIPKG